MLDAPRELLARALFPLRPEDPPLQALGFDPLLLGMSRPPTRSAPPAPLLLPTPLAERLLTPGLGCPWAPPARLLAPAPCCEARAALEDWPRADPPYLLAVPLSP